MYKPQMQRCKSQFERSFNRVYKTTGLVELDGLKNGIKHVQPITRCNDVDVINDLRVHQTDNEGFQHFRPLDAEKYYYTIPYSKDDTGKWVLKPFELVPFKRLSLDEIDIVLRCKLQRHRHHIHSLFRDADCLDNGFITKAALIRIFHNLCREMQFDQFHQILRRYDLDKMPGITFKEFEETFGVPPVGKTKAPVLKVGFGFDHLISVAQAYAKMFEAARQPGFNLKELLPPSCFKKDGRILMAQMREFLARIRLNMNEENFLRLWNQKLDLQGAGSISIQQFLSHMNLTEDGILDSVIKTKDLTFPFKHRLHYAKFNGNQPILRENICVPFDLIPITKRNDAADMDKFNIPKAGGISFPLPPEPTWKSMGPGGTNVPPMGCGTRYKDRLELLRQHRPFFRNIMENLRYIFEERYEALRVVFKKTDAQNKGIVTEARLFDILRELGLSIEPRQLTKFVEMVKVAVDDQICGNIGEAPTGKSEEARVGFINYEKFLRRFQLIAPGTHVFNVIIHIRRKRHKDNSMKGLISMNAEEIEEHFVKVLHEEYINFVEILEANTQNGGIDLKTLQNIVDGFIGKKMTCCQWEEFRSYLPLKSEGIMNCSEFLNYFIKPAGIPPKETTQIFTSKIPIPDLNEAKYTGDPRDLRIVLSLLERFIDKKFAAIDKMFKHFDHARPGLISKDDFALIMRDHGFKLIPLELNAIWRLVEQSDPSMNGQHQYRQVMRFLFMQTRAIQSKRLPHKNVYKLHDPNLAKLKEMYLCQRQFKAEHNKQLLALGQAARVIKYQKRKLPKPTDARVVELCNKIRQIIVTNWNNIFHDFLLVDPTGWGSILHNDFTRLAKTFNFLLNDTELQELARGFDKKNNGYVQYRDFFQHFADHEPTKSKQSLVFNANTHELLNKKDGSKLSIRSVVDKIRDMCITRHNTLLLGFKAMAGKHHPNYLSMDDLEQMLKHCNIILSKDDQYHLQTTYDRHRRGFIDYVDFQQLSMSIVKPS